MTAVVVVPIQSAHPFLMYALGVIWLGLVGGLQLLGSVDTSDLEAVLLQAVRDAMTAAHLSDKEMAFKMRLDEKQFRRQLAGEPQQYLALVKLFRAPFSFWCFFGPALIALVARKRFQEVAEDAKASERRAV